MILLSASSCAGGGDWREGSSVEVHVAAAFASIAQAGLGVSYCETAYTECTHLRSAADALRMTRTLLVSLSLSYHALILLIAQRFEPASRRRARYNAMQISGWEAARTDCTHAMGFGAALDTDTAREPITANSALISLVWRADRLEPTSSARPARRVRAW